MKDINGGFFQQPGNPGALINNDLDGYNAFLLAEKHREETRNKLNEINNIKQEVDGIKQDISDIKSLLLKVLENK